MALDVIQTAVSDGDVPGASVLITQHGRQLAARSFGVSDIESRRPFQNDTICWIASLTKPFTAAAAMKLVEQGKLDLDDSIEKYLPEFASQTTSDGRHFAVAVRQLMCHASGIQSSVPLRPGLFFTQSWFSRTIEEVAPEVAGTHLLFEPGQAVEYSNAAPYVLGRIIELQSQQAFGDFLQSNILTPLNLADTGFRVSRDKLSRAAVVYRREKDARQIFLQYDPNWNVRMTMPDGGLFSTPADIARFAEAFLNGGRGILSKDSVESMLAKQSEGYGLGWILDRENQFSHWGSSGTLVWADRRTGVVGVVFMQIQDIKRVEQIHRRFRDAVTLAVAQL